ncbi:lysophospholipid acyltransferase family protein [Roseovarius ramblicola]|uniref:Lysophospholipid acyltransferase family protein n=1 Tax=Roseovarius ramblicola TaxID=2022336 RepID=A0ABV5I0Q3_9RHOB
MAKYYLLPKRLMNRLQWVQTPIWLIEASVFHVLLGVARVMPYPVVAGLFARLIGGFGYRNAQKRRIVRRNMAVVLPQAGESARDTVARQVFRATGLAAAELFLLGRLWRRRDRYLEFSIHPEAQDIIARKEAVVFATAHVGAWQLCNLVGRETGIVISVIYAQEPNPWLRRFFLARRRAFGGPLVPSAGGARAFLRELAAGRSVGGAFDTRVDQGETVPFFGVPTPTSTLPAMLAVRGHPLLPIRTVRLPDHRFRIEVDAPLTPTDPDAPRAARITDLTRQLNARFEAWIREYPGEWVCLKRRWPKAPRKRAPGDV